MVHDDRRRGFRCRRRDYAYDEGLKADDDDGRDACGYSYCDG